MLARTVSLPSSADTEELGIRLGKILTPGRVIGLIGPLGAGKTLLTRAIARGLGVENPLAVNSPTFVLIQEYPGPIPLYHFDTYRLRDSREFLELGSDEYLTGSGVCILEWADKVEDVLPADRLMIQLRILGESTREAQLWATGPHSEQLLGMLFPTQD